MGDTYSELLRYTLPLFVAFLVAGIIITVSGSNPYTGLTTIITISFSNLDVFSLFVQKFSVILLMSLAFSIPFKAYRFNVGIEGQFLLGATGTTLVGIGIYV